MKRMLLSAMLFLGVATPALALAHEGQGGAATTKLSAEAREKVKDTRARFKPELQPVFADMKSARQSLRAELQKTQPDGNVLSQLEDRLTDDRQKMMAVRGEMQKELRSELTPQEYAQLMMSRHERFGRSLHI